MKKYKSFYILLCFCITTIYSISTVAQTKKIDSLLTLLKTDKADTNKIAHLIELSEQYLNNGGLDIALIRGKEAFGLASQLLKTNNNNSFEIKKIKECIANSYWSIGIVYYYRGEYDKTLNYWTKALNIDEALKNKNGIETRLGGIGNVYANQGDYPQALSYYFKALKISEEQGNKQNIATYNGNIGVIYMRQGNYPQALDYYFKALKSAEELGLKRNMSSTLSNIGIVYNAEGNYFKSLEYQFKALKIAEEIGDKKRIGSPCENIGDVYWNLHDYRKASDYYFKALAIAEEIGDKNAISKHLGNIGSSYKEQGKFQQALEYDIKSLKIAEETGDKTGIATTLGYIGMLYIEQKKYIDAYNCLYRSIAVNDSIGAYTYVKENYEMLSMLYEKANIALPDSFGGRPLNMEQMRLRSLHYYKRAIAIKDAIFNQESKKQLIQKEMNYKFEKKEAAIKLENEKQQAIAEEKNRKQKLIIWAIGAGLLLVLFFAGFIFRSLGITRKQKQIIEIKNEQTEQQKKIIEEKNKDITDSIHYAKRIQNALLREEERDSAQLPEHFILFLPKDIVSGDFYWGTEKQDFWYFAVADCTGHGVPGAIMSMLGISFLNDIVLSEESPCPAEILNRLRAKVIKELRQTDESIENRDGMDISLARLNIKTLKLQWAGANNPIHLIRKGELEKVKPDKQPIGYHLASKPFTNHEIQLQSGDSVYIYSDGYADQFGGPQGKKLGYKKLENLFLIHNHKPMKEQKDIFKTRFNEWKGLLEQTDDVCVFGVRI